MIKGELLLASGERFVGEMPAWQTDSFFGEVVFTTGMTGYVESLTDPSFAGQILVFTYPLIGNYGVPDASLFESKKIHVRGVIVSSLMHSTAHFQAQQSLLHWLKEQGIPILTGVDTRHLALTLRDHGVVDGVIAPANEADGAIASYAGQRPSMSEQALHQPRWPEQSLSHLVRSVSRTRVEEFGEGPHTIIAVDCGMKENILRHLRSLPIRIKVVPFDYDFTEEAFDGLFLSNGPGDPEECVETIAHVKKVLDRNIPIFGICLGTQILALALGAKTYKLRFGHRGLNQPVIRSDGRAYLTSQNHGYAVEEASLPPDWIVSYRHLNDDTVAGIAHQSKPYFAVQFHPEAAPGPRDTTFLFQEFYERILSH